MSTLKALNPQLFSMGADYVKHPTEDFAQAHSMEIDCPGCSGKPWTHRIWVPFKGKEPKYPGPSWRTAGGLEDLSLVDDPEGSRSIRMLGGCKSHFNITAGAIDFYGDSEHGAWRGYGA